MSNQLSRAGADPEGLPIDAAASRFLSDRDVAARVLAHIEHGSTDVGAGVWREPVAHYRSAERLERERELLRRWPVPLCPSAALRGRGSFLALESGGTPLLLVRGRDGRVRSFRNACRHRGMQLAAGEGCARRFVCPYHGWVYDLDGALRHVSHAHGFPGLDKAEHGLVEVACDERLGLVFVTQEAPAEGASTALDALPELIGPGRGLLSTRRFEVGANWKVYLEGFIEGYHIRATHPESFFPFGFDNLNVVETVGPNARVTYPFRRIAKLAELAPEERRVEGLLTYVYHLFPNALVTVLSHHTNLVVLEPVALDRTGVAIFTLANAGEGGGVAAAERDVQFVNQSGAAEDLAVVEGIQRSIGSGANESFVFGRFEAAIAHFHRSLHRWLGDGMTSEDRVQDLR